MDAEHEQQDKPDTFDTDKVVLLASSDPTRHLGGSDTEIQTTKIGTNEAQHGPKLFEKPEKVGIDRYFELLLTCAIVYLAWSQVQIAKASSESSTTQLSQIIVAAGRINDAADSFSKSSADIERGVSDAVEKLNLQAGALVDSAEQARRLAKDTEEANRMAKFGLEAQASNNRALLDVGGFGKVSLGNGKVSFEFAVRNNGQTQAINIHYAISTPHSVRWDKGDHRSLIEEQTAKAGGIDFSSGIQTGGIPDILGKDSADPVMIISTGFRNFSDFYASDIGLYYYGKLDFDDIYGEKWERKFCVVVGGDFQSSIPTYRRRDEDDRFGAADCNISEENLRHRPDDTKNQKRK
jgi:hypothetical protein